MNGTRFALRTNPIPAAMNARTITTFTPTITSLNRALSLIPTTSNPVIAAITSIAGTLIRASLAGTTPRHGALAFKPVSDLVGKFTPAGREVKGLRRVVGQLDQDRPGRGGETGGTSTPNPCKRLTA